MRPVKAPGFSPRRWLPLLALSAASLLSCTQAQLRAEPTLIRLLTPSPTPAVTLTEAIQHLNEAMPNLRLAVQPATGSLIVTSAIQTGDGEVGLAQADVVYLAYRKGTPTHAYPHLNLRGVAVGGLNRLCVYVRRDGPIRTITDLRGKRVAIAPAGTAGELLSRMVLEAYGISYTDVQMKVHQIREMGRSFATEQLDAMIMVGTFDPETYPQPTQAKDLRLLAIERDAINHLRSQYPFVKPASVRWREGRDRVVDVQTVGADTLLICRKDLQEDVVYRLTKAVITDTRVRDQFSIDADTAPATPIPLHPGAARFYRELQLLK
jgi:TRAP transporter TAXI family solute receptor